MRKETVIRVLQKTAEVFEVIRSRRTSFKKPIGVSGFPGRGSGEKDLFKAERDWWRRADPRSMGGVSGFPGRGSRNATELTFQEQFGGKMPHPLPKK